MTRRLLKCGALASAVYLAADVTASITHPGYHSYKTQFVSELSAIGAPTRLVVLPFLTLHALLVIAFGAGIWRMRHRIEGLGVSGLLLMALGIVDLGAPSFAMHLRGAQTSLTDTMHIVMTFVSVVLIVGAAAFAADDRMAPRFRAFSFAAITVMILFGAMTAPAGARIAAGEPTPWAGLLERICIGAYLLWQAALSLALTRLSASSTAVSLRAAFIP